jgi:hypothetical protein
LPEKCPPKANFGGLISLAVVALLTTTVLSAATVRVLVLLARSFMPALSLSALMLASATLLLTAAAIGVLLRRVLPTLVLALLLPALMLLPLLLVHDDLLELPCRRYVNYRTFAVFRSVPPMRNLCA